MVECVCVSTVVCMCVHLCILGGAVACASVCDCVAFVCYMHVAISVCACVLMCLLPEVDINNDTYHYSCLTFYSELGFSKCYVNYTPLDFMLIYLIFIIKIIDSTH